MAKSFFHKKVFLWFFLGCVIGIVVQKFYGVGNLRTVFQTNSASLTRTSLPIAQLPDDGLMVVLAFGQSNSANYGESPSDGGEHVYNFHIDTLFTAHDPLLGADGSRGSVWTRLGKKIIRSKKATNIIFITIGVGDSSIFRWSKYGDLHNKILYAIQATKKAGLTISHIFWHQGETDANLFQTSKSEYQRLLHGIISSIRKQNVQAPIYISIATRIKGALPNAEIRSAQLNVVNNIDIFLGPDTDQLDETYRYDGTHFSDEGLEKVADLWIRALWN